MDETQSSKPFLHLKGRFSEKETAFLGSGPIGAFWEPPERKKEDSKCSYKMTFDHRRFYAWTSAESDAGLAVKFSEKC